MLTVNTKTVRKLVRPRPLHAWNSVEPTQYAVEQVTSSLHLSGQVEATLQNTKCVRKLFRPRPLHVLNPSMSIVASRDSFEGTSTQLSLSPSELTPSTAATTRPTPEREVFLAFEALFSTIVEDDKTSFRRIADTCGLIKKLRPVINRECKEQLDQYFDKLRQVTCNAKLHAAVRLMLLE